MKLAWAYNPFDDDRRLERRAVDLLRRLRRARQPLELVYVASPGEPSLAVAFDVPIAERYGRHPQQLIERAARRLGIRGARVAVLPQRRPSLSAAVRALATHLHQRRIALTLIASHARRGVSRLVLGSFAESLVHVARTDLLVFNAASRVRRAAPRNLLFAHDLSAAGERGLGAALRYARAWGCALHVVHVPAPGHGGAAGSEATAVAAYRRRVQPRLARLERRLQRAGLAGSIAVAPRLHPVAAQVLRRAADVDADLLLVVAKSGPAAGWLGGSVTRALLRSAAVPVLVLKRG